MDLGHVKWKEYSNLNETFIPLDSQNATHFTILEKKDVPIFVFFTNKEQVGINRHAGDDHW